MDNILKGNKNNKIDEGNPSIISKIRGVIFYLEKDNTNKIVETINKNQIELYITSTINCINSAKNNNSTFNQIYDVIELAIYFLYYNIKFNNQRIRNLEEYQNNLKYIVDNAHYSNYISNINMTVNYNMQSDGLNLISFICYKKNAIDDAFKNYIKNITFSSNITGYINLMGNDINNDELVILTLLNKKLYLNEAGQTNGIIFNFSTNNPNTNLNNLKDFRTYVYSSDINVNYDLANYYQTNNISIYYKYDECFTEPCYFNKNFKYDLTQKYRKKNVFQKWSVENTICRYNSFEIASNNIELFCSNFESFENTKNINYAVLTLTMKQDYIENQDKVYNLPMRCPNKIDALDENYGFWFFLIICILEFCYIIGINILTLGSLRRVSIRKGLVNDELYYKIPRNLKDKESESTSSEDTIKKKIRYKSRYPKDKIIQNSVEEFKTQEEAYFNKTLIECIINNFKELHPLPSLCRVSIISPLILHSWFFVFNLLCLFGFNALIYYEGLIEKRIYDKKRNNFDYPMRKEFHKIILSILCQIALTTLLKLLVLVSLRQRDNLEYSLKSCKLKENEEINNEIVTRIDQFENEMLLRRLLGGLLMVIIVVFFFYYTVVFCGIYIHTQKNWMFSCIWSLFWNWIVFCPIYIVIISFIEHKKQDSYNPLVYNLKRLFFF